MADPDARLPKYGLAHGDRGPGSLSLMREFWSDPKGSVTTMLAE